MIHFKVSNQSFKKTNPNSIELRNYIQTKHPFNCNTVLSKNLLSNEAIDLDYKLTTRQNRSSAKTENK